MHPAPAVWDGHRVNKAGTTTLNPTNEHNEIYTSFRIFHLFFLAVRHRHQQSIQRECTLHPLAESQDCKHCIHCPSSSSSMWGSFGKHLHFQGCKQKPHSFLSWRAYNQHCMCHNDSFGFARSAGHMCYNRHLPLLSRKMLHRYHWTTSCSLHCRSCTCCLLHRSYTNGLVLPHTSSSGLR